MAKQAIVMLSIAENGLFPLWIIIVFEPGGSRRFKRGGSGAAIDASQLEGVKTWLQQFWDLPISLFGYLILIFLIHCSLI